MPVVSSNRGWLPRKRVMPSQQVTYPLRSGWQMPMSTESWRASNESLRVSNKSFRERIEHDGLTPTSGIGMDARVTNRELNKVRNHTDVTRQY